MQAPSAERPGWALSVPPLFPLAADGGSALPGFSPFAPADWLFEAPDQAAQRSARRALLAARKDAVLGTLDGAGPAVQELVRLVDGVASTDLDLETAAHQLSQRSVEDWILLAPGGCGWTFAAGIVCFPAQWHLSQKLGLPMHMVHAPVPQYTQDLNARVSRVLDRLLPAAPGVQRVNWSLDPGSGLFAPPGAPTPYADWAPFLRIERQTLRKLPESGCIAFGIRTLMTPVADLSALHKAYLCAALRALPGEVRRYKMSDATFRTVLETFDQAAKA